MVDHQTPFVFQVILFVVFLIAGAALSIMCRSYIKVRHQIRLHLHRDWPTKILSEKKDTLKWHAQVGFLLFVPLAAVSLWATKDIMCSDDARYQTVGMIMSILWPMISTLGSYFPLLDEECDIFHKL